MRSHEGAALVLGREHLARVEAHAQLGLVGGELDLRLGPLRRRVHALQVRCRGGARNLHAVAVDVRVAEVFTARLGDAVQFAGRDVVAHAVGLVVGEPDGLVLGVDVHAHGVPHATRDHFTLAAVEGVELDHAADADLLIQRHFFLGLHVVGLTQRHIDLTLVVDAAGACAVVVAFFFNGDQLALRHHLDDGHVRAFIEELGRGEVEHAVVLGDDQEAVACPAHAVGVGELQAGREGLHLVGHAVAVAVGDGPHGGLAGAHEEHVGAGRNGHVAGVGHHGEEVDGKARRQLDALEVGADGVGVAPGLRHHRDVQVGGGDLHLLELLDVLLRRGWQRHRASHCGSGQAGQSWKTFGNGHRRSPVICVHECTAPTGWRRDTAMRVPSGEHPNGAGAQPGGPCAERAAGLSRTRPGGLHTVQKLCTCRCPGALIPSPLLLPGANAQAARSRRRPARGDAA